MLMRPAAPASVGALSDGDAAESGRPSGPAQAGFADRGRRRGRTAFSAKAISALYFSRCGSYRAFRMPTALMAVGSPHAPRHSVEIVEGRFDHRRKLRCQSGAYPADNTLSPGRPGCPSPGGHAAAREQEAMLAHAPRCASRGLCATMVANDAGAPTRRCGEATVSPLGWSPWRPGRQRSEPGHMLLWAVGGSPHEPMPIGNRPGGS